MTDKPTCPHCGEECLPELATSLRTKGGDVSERIVEQRWVQVKVQCMERRLDTLRQMADYRARKIERSEAGSRRHDEMEHAALMWAIAELSGIGDEVRRERREMESEKLGTVRKMLKRAEISEALNVQFRVRVDALKAEVHRLSRLASLHQKDE